MEIQREMTVFAFDTMEIVTANKWNLAFNLFINSYAAAWNKKTCVKDIHYGPVKDWAQKMIVSINKPGQNAYNENTIRSKIYTKTLLTRESKTKKNIIQQNYAQLFGIKL